MTTEDKKIKALLEENNRLQQQAIDLLLNMRRAQMVRFGISVIIIVLPIIAAFVVLPRFITGAIDQFGLTKTTQETSMENSK